MGAELRLSFGYNAQDGYYYGKNGIIGLYHKGKDWITVNGNYVLFIGDTKIGYLGQTGAAGGIHVHVQAGYDMYAQTPINPTNHEFKPGTVVQVGWGSAWGNYVIIKTGNVYVVYAHFQEVYVTPGDIIKGDTMTSATRIKKIYRKILFREADASGINHYKSKGEAFVWNDLSDSGERRTLEANVKKWKLAYPRVKSLEKALSDKTDLIAQIRADAESVEGGLKADLEKAQARIIELTKQDKDIDEDLDEALDETPEQPIESSWVEGFIAWIKRIIKL